MKFCGLQVFQRDVWVYTSLEFSWFSIILMVITSVCWIVTILFFFLFSFKVSYKFIGVSKKKKNCYKDLGMICLTGLVYLIVSMIFPYLKWPFGCDCNLALLYTMMSWPFLKEQYRSWNGVLQILVLVFQSVLHVTLLEFIETWCCWNFEKGLFFLSDAST